MVSGKQGALYSNSADSKMPVTLSIAGSDPCGGAGIQMDLKVFHAHSVWGAAAITALTVQNTTGVRELFPLPAEIVQRQVETILEDLPVRAIKLGMLMDETVVNGVAEAITKSSSPIIADPVMISSSGTRLLTREGVQAFQNRIMPMATVVTPNIPEACILAQLSISNHKEMEEAAVRIWTLSGKRSAVLIKGGHARGAIAEDILFDGEKMESISWPMLQAGEVHGTGCALSAAIAANMARGYSLFESVIRSKKFITKAIENRIRAGTGSQFLGV